MFGESPSSTIHEQLLSSSYISQFLFSSHCTCIITYNGAKIVNSSKPSAAVSGIGLIKPVSGIITSRFGPRSSGNHTGLDIANSTGTPIKAAAAGTVIYSGYKGSYGKLIIVAHTNSIQTYYAHCSRLYVSAGQTVSQGEVIAAVGSTGNSTGPHLHLEVRVNGVARNPQNYVYGR